MNYNEFLDDYRAFIATLPGTVNLPNGWFQNWRGWDMYQCYRAGVGDHILDTGALHTFGCLYWAKRGAKVAATDSYKWARRAIYRGLMTPYEWECVMAQASGGRVIAYQEGVTNIAAVNGAFNTILSISTIEHVEDDAAAMREMYRVLEPGGKLMITTEYNAEYGKPYSEDDGSYYRVYDKGTLAALLDGYNVISRVEDMPREPFTTVFVCIEKEGA